MRALVRAVDRISHFCGVLAAVLVIVLVVLMLYDVVLRYAFNAPTTWGNDLNAFLMGASFVLSIAYAHVDRRPCARRPALQRANAAAPGLCRPDRADSDRPAGRGWSSWGC